MDTSIPHPPSCARRPHGRAGRARSCPPRRARPPRPRDHQGHAQDRERRRHADRARGKYFRVGKGKNTRALQARRRQGAVREGRRQHDDASSRSWCRRRSRSTWPSAAASPCRRASACACSPRASARRSRRPASRRDRPGARVQAGRHRRQGFDRHRHRHGHRRSGRRRRTTPIRRARTRPERRRRQRPAVQQLEAVIGTDPCKPRHRRRRRRGRLRVPVGHRPQQRRLPRAQAVVPYPGKRPYPNPLDATDANTDSRRRLLTLAEEYQALGTRLTTSLGN